MGRSNYIKNDYSSITDDEMINCQQFDSKNLPNYLKDQNLISSLDPIFLIKNLTCEKITMILKRFSILLMNEEKFSSSFNKDLKKETEEVLIDLIQLMGENELSIGDSSTNEFHFKITMNETIQLIGLLIKNRSYAFSKNIPSEMKKELVSDNNKMINYLFDLSLRPIFQNQIRITKEEQLNSLVKSQNQTIINQLNFDESKDNANEYQTIWRAIKEKNLKAVDYFVTVKQIDLKAKRSNNQTCLHYAAESGNLEIVKYLVSKGADINARDKNHNLPLHLALKEWHLEILKYFITELKMDPDSKGFSKQTCLHQAIEFGNLEMVKYLMLNGADIYTRDGYSNQPLHLAVESDNLEIVKLLVSKGADINARNKVYNLPLHTACKIGNLEIVKYFIGELKMDPNLKEMNFLTCLHYAVESSNLTMIQYLISKGADINARNKVYNLPLHTACKIGNLEIVKYFINELNMDCNSKGEQNLTCLHYATQSSNIKTIQFLVSKGADINARDGYYDLPLHTACKMGHLEIVKYFIGELKMNPNSIGMNSRTCLHYAAESGKITTVQYLISKGADINARSSKNLPLHVACKNGHLEMLKYFINELNMDCNSKGDRDRTCLHFAADSSNLEIVQYLTCNGAVFNVNDHYNGLNKFIIKLREEIK